MILNIVSFRNCSLERNLALRTNEPIDLSKLIETSINDSEVVSVKDAATGAILQFRPEDVLYISNAEETESVFDNDSKSSKAPLPKKKGIASISVKEE